MTLRNLPTRLATGAFVLHSGLEKWSADEQTAQGLHGFASAAYPFLGSVEPKQFVRSLSVGEIAVGTALLAPVVPTAAAGAALTGFAAGLVGLYWRAPGLRRQDSVWPTQDGIGVAKDVWMLGIGAGLVLDALTRRRG